MRLRTRIERLEQRAKVVASGKIPLAVIDRIINGTISELEYKRYLPTIEEIIAAAQSPSPLSSENYG